MEKGKEHAGHRDRMRKRFLDTGLDGFEPHETLEMLLFYAVPMKNTSILAHQLIDRFGSISAVFDAPLDLLTEFGLTERQAMFLKMIPEVCRVYLDDKYNNTEKIIRKEKMCDYLITKFIGRQEECVILLLLDSKGRELFCGVVSKGGSRSSQISIRRIVDLAMRCHASVAVIAHNHPSGVAFPSSGDFKTTEDVKKALALVGVKLADHIIVADDDCISMSDSGMM